MDPDQINDIEAIDPQIARRYEVIEKIGKGAYGVVWKVRDRFTKQNSNSIHQVDNNSENTENDIQTESQDGKIYALKKVFCAFQNSTDAQRCYREVSYLRELKNHPFIISLHAVHRSENDLDLYLLFDIMETDVHAVIRANILLDVHHRYIFWQLLCALKFIHSANLIHRDLKPSNLLINSNASIKLCDFGLSRTFKTANLDHPDLDDSNRQNGGFIEEEFTDYVATRWYRPPEILFGASTYTPSVDMWSAGCILAELVTGKPLLPGASTMDQIEKVIAYTGPPTQSDIQSINSSVTQTMLSNLTYSQPRFKFEERFSGAPRDAIDLIRKLTTFNPSDRLTAAQALEHPYVAQFHVKEKEIEALRPINLTLDDSRKFTTREYRNCLYREAVTAPDMPSAATKKKRYHKEGKHSHSKMKSSQEWV
ncbi:CMGC family protein kinase [Tritrichomonas foetus]|uniref:CMGC family protein kinase n=1 Tax=Tritrichomonas foetus TaxID=1144522 RepID=A0A1J4KA31_9EUKA|nr:CMGC family protein kinase [Tritrichomonas foetus]|eukprot:OHT07784.1 CMGC family protein kinase [Tritrichomonas foetus]